LASELLRWNVDGASVIIETDEAEIDGWASAGVFGGSAIHEAQIRLEDALANVGKVAKAALRAAPSPPNATGIERPRLRAPNDHDDEGSR